MANRYVRSTGGNYNAAGTWELTAGGGETVAVPTAADDVFLVAGSGQLTINVGSVCRSFNCTGYANTITHAAVTLTIGDGTAPASGIALLLAGTYTPNSSAGITFNSTAVGTHVIDFAGKSLATGAFVIFSSTTTASYQLANGFTGYGISHQGGTLDFNGKTLTFTAGGGSLSTTGTAARTLTFGSSKIIFSGNGGGLTYSGSGLAITNNTATFEWTGASGSFICIDGTNFNGLNLNVLGSGNMTFSNSATVNRIYINPTATTKGFVVNSGKTITATTFWCYPTSGTVTLNSAGGSLSVASGTVNMYQIATCNLTLTGGATFKMKNNFAGTVASALAYGFTIDGGDYYLDLVNGDNSIVLAYGFYKVAYTSASGTCPIIGEIMTGGSSGFTAKVTYIDPYEWLMGAGTMYFEYKTGTFTTETLTGGTGSGSCSIAADLANSAWLSTTSGATAARIDAADEIKYAETAAPTILAGATGNATWNNNSKAVTLADAQTKTVTLCESAWTASANVTCSTSTTRKQGSYAATVYIAAGFTTGKAAYFALGSTQDFSAYQKLTFWFRNSAAVTANYLKVCLCSDTAGASIVDTFFIPAIPSTNQYLPLTITKNSGGNLGSSIQSVAIYADTDPAAVNLLIDNIEACTTSGLNLQSLLSKNTLKQTTVAATNYGNEGWYPIQSINGTTVLLDATVNTLPTISRGYEGVTETVSTYYRETFKTALAAINSTIVNDVLASGLSGYNITYSGGWDKTTGLQTGETFMDGLNGNGYAFRFNAQKYTTFKYISFARYYAGYYCTSSSLNTLEFIGTVCACSMGVFYNVSNSNILITAINLIGNGDNIYYSSAMSNYAENIYNASNATGQGLAFYMSFNNIVNNAVCKNNGDNGLYFNQADNNIVRNYTSSGNSTASIKPTQGNNYIGNITAAESTVINIPTAYADTRTSIGNLSGYTLHQGEYFTAVTQAATAGGTGLEWKISVTNIARDSSYPAMLCIARVACNASSLVTIKAYMKKSHASDIVAALSVPANQLAGVAPSDSLCPSDTSRNEVSITFTPSEAGIVEIYAKVYWAANTADKNVIVDDMTITQA